MIQHNQRSPSEQHKTHSKGQSGLGRTRLQDFWQGMVADSKVYVKLCVTSFTGCG